MNLRKPRVYKDAGGWLAEYPDGSQLRMLTWERCMFWALAWLEINALYEEFVCHLEPCS